jgi:putative addiction module component (TIGR02574 family)
MNSLNEVLNTALALNEKERAIIAEKILLSLDTDIDAQSEKKWQEEIVNRINEIDNGKVNLISWEEAKKRMS